MLYIVFSGLFFFSNKITIDLLFSGDLSLRGTTYTNPADVQNTITGSNSKLTQLLKLKLIPAIILYKFCCMLGL